MAGAGSSRKYGETVAQGRLASDALEPQTQACLSDSLGLARELQCFWGGVLVV